MNDAQLNCFLAVCRTLNFSRAAAQLFITQPALSYQIRSLEKELGVKLFERSTTQVSLTDAGNAFVGPAQALHRQYFAALDAVRPFVQRQSLVLQLPMVMAVRDPIYHAMLHRIHEALPEYGLEVRTELVNGPMRALLSQGVDAILQMSTEPDEAGVACRPLFQTQCYFVAGPHHPLAGQAAVTPAQLAGRTICYEPGERNYVRLLQSRFALPGDALHWREVTSYELSYPDLLSGKCLFVSPMRYDAFPQEWYLPLHPATALPATSLFTLADDARPCIATLIETICTTYQAERG
jgi:DNA-binding transcriptional LysR family regulator